MNQKRLGVIITAISIIIIILMVTFQIQLNNQNAKACDELCGGHGAAICPYHENSNSAFLIVTSLLTAFMTGIGLYLLRAGNEKIITQKEYDLTKFEHLERDIFLFIKGSTRGVYQSDLAKTFSLSKVKVTRILDKLESLDYIERKRRGMTNIVVAK